MPLLAFLLRELDRELDRLGRLRRVVADLVQTPELVQHLLRSDVSPSATHIESPLRGVRKRRRGAGKPRGPRSAKTVLVSEMGALASSIPPGPVVYYPGKAGSGHQPPQAKLSPNEAAPISTDLEHLSRQIAVRWSPGSQFLKGGRFTAKVCGALVSKTSCSREEQCSARNYKQNQASQFRSKGLRSVFPTRSSGILAALITLHCHYHTRSQSRQSSRSR